VGRRRGEVSRRSHVRPETCETPETLAPATAWTTAPPCRRWGEQKKAVAAGHARR
jgi:hypothetical protein